MVEVAVTGHLSGLGRHLVSEEGFSPFPESASSNYAVDIAVHCGYTMPDPTNLTLAFSDVERQISLTNYFLERTAGLFIYISTIDVYPHNPGIMFSEDTKIDLRDVKGHHAMLKLYLEQLVQKRSDNFCIIRPGLMMGRFARPNTLSLLIAGKPGPYSLASESEFSLVTHDSVGVFINEVCRAGLRGTWNFSSPDTISLREGAEMAGNSRAEFGDHEYLAPAVDSSRAVSTLGAPLLPSRKIIEKMLDKQH